MVGSGLAGEAAGRGELPGPPPDDFGDAGRGLDRLNGQNQGAGAGNDYLANNALYPTGAGDIMGAGG